MGLYIKVQAMSVHSAQIASKNILDLIICNGKTHSRAMNCKLRLTNLHSSHVRVHHVNIDKDDPRLRDVLSQRPDPSSHSRRRRIEAT